MKTLLKSVVIYAASFLFVTQLVPTVVIDGGWQSYLSISAIFTVLNMLVRPVLELVFLPVNVLTLGAFRWVSAVIILWMTTLFGTTLSISAFNFAGLSSHGVVLPSASLSLPMTYIVIAFVFSVCSSLISWVFH